ncbi:MAG TPA: ATP-binding protein [Kofleriaceae bacterium]|jgi:signal transduction histidine kinase
MGAINAYLGAYHLILALRRPKAREHLPFALLCFAVAAYDLFSAGFYDCTSLAQGVFWEGLQLQCVAPISMMMLWFIARLIGTERRTGVRVFLAWFAILVPLTFLRREGWTVSVSTPAIKHIVWGTHTIITYHESDIGVVFGITLVSAFIAYGYAGLGLFRHYRRNRSSSDLALLVGNVAYFAGAANDSLIAAGLYSSVYLGEYAFLILTLSMAYVLLSRFVDLQSDVEALNVNLERAVLQRTAALQRSLEQQSAMQDQLVAASRRSGMADVATHVLHNLGNALNSVNVSVNVLEDAVRDSRLSGLSKVVRRICGPDDVRYFTDDARASRVPEYLTASTAQLETERTSVATELASLRDHVEHIKVIVETQQPHAHAPGVHARTSLAAVLDEALSASLVRHQDRGVELERAYDPIPDIEIDRHKLLEILAGLLDNAWDALDGTALAPPRRIRLRLHAPADHRIAIDVEDTGRGIPPENLTRIFHHGFTTRAERRGFGLHASACATSELGGTLTATSGGPGLGARFTLTLPLRLATPATAATSQPAAMSSIP